MKVKSQVVGPTSFASVKVLLLLLLLWEDGYEGARDGEMEGGTREGSGRMGRRE